MAIERIGLWKYDNPFPQNTVSTDKITLAEIKRCAEILKRSSSLHTRKVETEAQAEMMTKYDAAGHVWHVGEEYYYYFFDNVPLKR